MIVFSVHERPLYTHNGNIYHPYLNVITKYFGLGDTIIYGCSNFIDIPQEKAEKLEKVKNANIKFIQLYRINSLKSLIQGIKYNNPILKTAIKNSDIIVARLPSFSGLQAIHWARKYKKPYMVELIGCAWDGYWNYGIKGKLLAPWIFLLTKRAVLNATHSVYVTDHFLQHRYPCKGKSIGASNVSINSVDPKILGERISRIESGQNNITKIATAAGIDNPVKGQQYVIKAISYLNSKENPHKYHYYLIGGGSSKFLKNVAKRYGVEQYIHFVGQISQKNVISFLSNIDIYIQPSKQEGLPRALIEAMSQGCPSIGSNIAGIPELLDKSCLFKKGKVNEIISLLKQFENKEIMKKQAIRNFETAKKYQLTEISKKRNSFFDEFKQDYNI